MDIFNFLPKFLNVGLVVGVVLGAMSAKLGYENLSPYVFVLGVIGTCWAFVALKRSRTGH